jgi:hypothetical protein
VRAPFEAAQVAQAHILGADGALAWPLVRRMLWLGLGSGLGLGLGLGFGLGLGLGLGFGLGFGSPGVA